MIVNDPEGEAVTCVAQAEHGRHAGTLAQALADPPHPRGPFEDATASHDDGWRAYDREPGWNEETGLPHTYRSIPTPDYVEVWRRGFREAREAGPHAELLVSLHGSAFLERRDSEAAKDLVADQRARQDELVDQLGYEGTWDDLPSTVARQREWMGFLDALSLFVLDRWGSPWRAEVAGSTLEARRDGARATVDPWPFDQVEVAAEVPVVVLEDGPYGSPEAMAAALASAPRGTRSVTLAEPGRFGDPSAKA